MRIRWLLIVGAAALAAAIARGADPPLGPGCVGPCESDYPPSSAILDFDMMTLGAGCPGTPCARGSDSWPIIWADDDHQYTSWGDGCGFGGDTANECEDSLGFGRVEGDRESYNAVLLVGLLLRGGFRALR